jgi:hypothetical protein
MPTADLGVEGIYRHPSDADRIEMTVEDQGRGIISDPGPNTAPSGSPGAHLGVESPGAEPLGAKPRNLSLAGPIGFERGIDRGDGDQGRGERNRARLPEIFWGRERNRSLSHGRRGCRFPEFRPSPRNGEGGQPHFRRMKA